MSWMWLFLAIVLEVAATVCMKLSDGFTRRLPTAAMAVLYLLSFIPMTWAIRRLDVSIAYAVWSAVGTALISVVGVYLFKEAFTASKLIALALIVTGVLVLNLTDTTAGGDENTRASLKVEVAGKQPTVSVSERTTEAPVDFGDQSRE